MIGRTLWQGKWVSVVNCNVDYECLHEKDIVLVIPVIDEDIFVVREEFCPPYFAKENEQRLYYTVISGKIEDKENWEKAMLREVKEEAGIVIDPMGYTLMILFENKPLCKSTDMRGTFVILEVGKYTREKPKGDGTVNEKLSRSLFCRKDLIDWFLGQDNIDMLLIFGLSKLKELKQW